MRYVRKTPEVEAMKPTEDDAAEVAAWCHGMVTPTGLVAYPQGDGYPTVPPGHYLVRDENGHLATIPAADFEAAWAPAEDA